MVLIVFFRASISFVSERIHSSIVGIPSFVIAASNATVTMALRLNDRPGFLRLCLKSRSCVALGIDMLIRLMVLILISLSERVVCVPHALPVGVRG